MENTAPHNGEPPLADLILEGALGKELGLGDRELGLALAVANMKLKSGNAEKALSMYAILVLCKPLDVEYQCGLANCAVQMQEYEMALQAASAIIGLAPRDCRGYYFSGAACLGLGKISEAREDVSDAMKFAENTADRAFLEASQKLNALLNASFP